MSGHIARLDYSWSPQKVGGCTFVRPRPYAILSELWKETTLESNVSFMGSLERCHLCLNLQVCLAGWVQPRPLRWWAELVLMQAGYCLGAV